MINAYIIREVVTQGLSAALQSEKRYKKIERERRKTKKTKRASKKIERTKKSHTKVWG
jgi:hypothetical protein